MKLYARLCVNEFFFIIGAAVTVAVVRVSVTAFFLFEERVLQ